MTSTLCIRCGQPKYECHSSTPPHPSLPSAAECAPKARRMSREADLVVAAALQATGKEGTMSLKLVLLVAAVVCFALAAFNIAQGRLVPAGLACWAAAGLV